METSTVLFFETTQPVTPKDGQHVCVIGDLSIGHQVYGPFESFDAAAHWYDYESALQHINCWIMELKVPDVKEERSN